MAKNCQCKNRNVLIPGRFPDSKIIKFKIGSVWTFSQGQTEGHTFLTSCEITVTVFDLQDDPDKRSIRLRFYFCKFSFLWTSLVLKHYVFKLSIFCHLKLLRSQCEKHKQAKKTCITLSLSSIDGVCSNNDKSLRVVRSVFSHFVHMTHVFIYFFS